LPEESVVKSPLNFPFIAHFFFLCCDIQERFRDLIKFFPDVVNTANFLISSSKIFNIPVIATEQYPKALGKIVGEIDTSTVKTFPKMQFSMLTPQVHEYIKSLKGPQNEQLNTAVLFGIENHVCVLQTSLDLLENGYQVHVVSDGCSSRNFVDRNYGFERMKQSGAFLTTAESIVFQLMGTAEFSRFKEISALIKQRPPFPTDQRFHSCM